MYSDYYGLTDRAFQLTPDPRFYFESTTHKRALAYLGYGLAQGEGFIVVTGEIGAGKTTLVAHLMEEVDPARVLAAKIVSTNVEAEDVLHLAATALGLTDARGTKAQLLDQIEQFLQARAREGRKVLLIVDEAQNLPISALEELRMLSNFQQGNRALLQILMLGQPEFRDKLATPALEQLRQRVIATHHLQPMELAETGPYLLHRLNMVGYAGRPHFTEEAFAALHEASGGISRRLNGLAERLLLMGALEKQDRVDAVLVQAVVADTARDEGPKPSSVAPHAPDTVALDHAARITTLEAQVEEQGAALRRVLTLLLDWVEQEGGAVHAAQSMRSPAA